MTSNQKLGIRVADTVGSITSSADKGCFFVINEPNYSLCGKKGIQNDILPIYLHLPNGVRIILSYVALYNDDHDAFEINQCLTCRERADCNCIRQYLKKLDKRAFCSVSDTHGSTTCTSNKK